MNKNIYASVCFIMALAMGALVVIDLLYFTEWRKWFAFFPLLAMIYDTYVGFKIILT